MTTEALVPATAAPAIATSGGGETVLPQVSVDAGPQATARFLRVLRGADRERPDAGGVRESGGAIPRVVRDARPRAA